MLRYVTVTLFLAVTILFTGCQDSFMGPDMMNDAIVSTAAESADSNWPAILKYEIRDTQIASQNRLSVAGIQSLSVQIQHSGPHVRLVISGSDRANFRLNTNNNTLRGTGVVSVGEASFDLSQVDRQNVSEMPREFELVGTTRHGEIVIGSLNW